ncbi:MAG: hypothetical protein A2W99_08490 [Bacteroidetes bacterium GWF2_33_16]|nr:MAG: hypothetical protein A2X00_00665 [Bacteroidetes bacterium GWE2_32_14]OFY05541.1 MAG: hypothetical protein A2W99_08490 [Bacteroidetes bacterium GWF2_33_16]
MIRKINLFALFVIVLGVSVNAQTYVIQVRPPMSDTWGYANLEGEIIIEPQFKKCYEFSNEGVALVYFSIKNSYKIVTLNGEIIDLENPDIIVKDLLGYLPSGFNSGLVTVRIGKKWGYMNTQGKISIPLQYDFASDFNNGSAVVRKGNQFFVIDVNGNESFVDVPDVKKVKDFAEGLAPYETSKGFSGFINSDGKVVIPAQFTGVGYFSSDMAWARKNKDLIGFINTNGEWVIQPQFLAAKNFDAESGLARVKLNDEWWYTDKSGNLIRPESADKTDDFKEGLAQASVNGKIGFLNNQMAWFIEPQFEAARDFKNGFAAVKKDGAWGVINQNGEWVIQPQFDSVKDVALVE